MCVPLCVVSVMTSHAQPSPPGRSEGFSPGNIEHMTSAFSLLETYLICGRMLGGSTTVSLSSGIEMSMIVMGRCMHGYPSLWRLLQAGNDTLGSASAARKSRTIAVERTLFVFFVAHWSRLCWWCCVFCCFF